MVPFYVRMVKTSSLSLEKVQKVFRSAVKSALIKEGYMDTNGNIINE